MGKIDELIKDLCPDGVEWLELCDIVKNVTPPIKIKIDSYLDSGIYPIIDQGKKQISGYTNEIEYTLPENEYILYGDHTLSVKYYDGRFAQGADGLKILTCSNSLTKFIYYCICTYNIQSCEYKRHWTKVKKIKLPLPSLSIQQQIVEILDTFTDAISNLQEELELRERQMEYYREKLFDFNEDEYEWKYIPEVASYSTGLTYKPTNISDSGILVLRSSNIKDNTLSYDDNVFVQMGIPNRSKIHKNDILICVRNGSKKLVGKCAYISELKYECAFGAFMNILRAHSIDSKFLYYSWLLNSTINQYKGDDAAPICQITNKDFNRIKIPVPSLTRQQEIVDILDTFESMITNIKEEIELRQKQYEYYREKLLTFERKEA